MKVDELLLRLERVEQKAEDRWMATCPAHKDKTASLSIRLMPDGRILFNDFGGCLAIEICDSLGIRLTDIMPPNNYKRFDPTEVRVPASDILELLDHEAMVVWLILQKVRFDEPLDERHYKRLSTAARRISDARAKIKPALIQRLKPTEAKKR